MYEVALGVPELARKCRLWFIDKLESSHARKALLNVVDKKLGY
jgi:hypothetical protein